MAEVTAARVRFRDVKPYDAPASLDELRGPYDGPIDLPHSVRWQADRFDVDVSNLGWRRMAYQALLAEGTADQQRRLMNRDRLIEAWPILNMDPRVRGLWRRGSPGFGSSCEQRSGGAAAHHAPGLGGRRRRCRLRPGRLGRDP